VVHGCLGGGCETGISSSELELALFVGDSIGKIVGVWLSFISARMAMTSSSLGVAIEF